MALTDPRRRNLILAAAVILLAWLAPVEAGRSPASVQQPPAPGGLLAYTLPFPDGVECQIVFPIVDVERVRTPDGRIGTRMVPVNNNGRARTEAELKDMNDAIAVFANALKSDDMQKKVREACIVHQRKNDKGQYQFLVGLTRNDPDLMTGLQLTGVNQVAVDLGDIPQIADHLSGGSQAGRDIVSSNWLTSVLAHEFDHARDGPATAAHRDPEGQCASDPQNPGEPTKDQNAVIADLQLGHTRVQYTYTAADGTTATDFTVTLNGQTETVTLNVTSLTGATFTDQPTQAAGPPSQPQTAGPPAPPPQPAGPPAPPRQPAGPPAPPRQHSGANHMLGIPEQACEGTTTTGCFGSAGAGDNDFDGLPNSVDNCPAQANPQQGDRNGNGIGDACDRSMPPCSAGWSFTDPKVFGSIGGAVLGGILIAAGGGDSPTATLNTPPTASPAPAPAPSPAPAPTPAPTPEPTPAPTPAPPPRTTADGRYRCVAVRIVSDEGRHNSTINLGPQLTGDFDVREGNGTITIRHPEPFVDIVNAQFDPATGRFSGMAVGRVAGSPNVGVRAEGTVNTTTGQVVFNYTMGTGGELPGGRPIVYEITLQKQ